MRGLAVLLVAALGLLIRVTVDGGGGAWSLLWGTLGVAGLFLTLTICGSLISRGAADNFTSFLALGLTVAIALQALLNMCVVTGALPTKGLALPFFSYGGSNLLLMGLLVGIIINSQRTWERPKPLVRRRSLTEVIA